MGNPIFFLLLLLIISLLWDFFSCSSVYGSILDLVSWVAFLSQSFPFAGRHLISAFAICICPGAGTQEGFSYSKLLTIQELDTPLPSQECNRRQSSLATSDRAGKSQSLWALSLSFRIFFGIFPFLCMFTPVFNYHCWWDLHLSLLRAALTLELPPFLQLLRAARPGTWELVRKTFKWFLLLGKFRKPEQFLCIQMSHNHPMHSMIKTIVTRKATCPKNLHWVRQIHTYSDGTFFKKAHEVRNHWTATIAVRAHFADICGASFQEEGSSISSARQFIPTTCRMCLDV